MGTCEVLKRNAKNHMITHPAVEKDGEESKADENNQSNEQASTHHRKIVLKRKTIRKAVDLQVFAVSKWSARSRKANDRGKMKGSLVMAHKT